MLERIKQLYRSLRASTRIFKLAYCAILNVGYGLGWFRIHNIPVIINNFNRLTFLIQLIQAMEKAGMTRIIIIDNNSSYPPLLEYYKTCNHEVVRCAINYGHLNLWKSGLYKRFRKNYFVYTDSDLIPADACPADFVAHFKSILDSHSGIDKVGFGITIDDLPDFFSPKSKVIDHEKKFWQHEISPGIYRAQIDTTFALYRPFSNLKYGETSTLAALRTGAPYLVKHLPWYLDSDNLSEEEYFFLSTSSNASSIAKQYRTGDVY